MNLPRVAQISGILPYGHAGVGANARASFGKHLLLTVFFLTIVLDFRRVEGDDNQLVMIMGIANLLLGAWYCLGYGYFTRLQFCWVVPFVLLAGAGTLTGILYGQDVYLVFSHAVPILSFLFATIAVHSISGDLEKKTGIKIILATSFIAAAAKFIFGFYYYDLNMENVRYQIIGGSVPLLFAYGLAGIFSRGRKLAVICISVSVIIVLFSVTRTYIIVFGLVALVCLYSYSKAVPRLAGTLAILAIMVPILTAVLTEFFPGILDRWSDRISNAEFGVDVTAAYRLAEAEFQLRRLSSDLAGLLFGYGHAAHTGLAGDNVRLIVSELGRGAADFYSFGYGHNFYVGLLYVGGVVFGLPVVVALFHLLWKGLQYARRTSPSPVDQFSLIWGVSAFTGYLGYGMLAGSFGDRSISFFFGVSAGLVLLGTEPARHVVSQISSRRAELRGDARTPKQRRVALAGQVSGLCSDKS